MFRGLITIIIASCLYCITRTGLGNWEREYVGFIIPGLFLALAGDHRVNEDWVGMIIN